MLPLVIVLLIVAPAFVGFGLQIERTFRLFDEILKAQYERHQKDWINDGRAKGYFWRPTRIEGSSKPFLTMQLCHRWMAETPEWAAQDPEAARLFLVYQRTACYRWHWLAACWVSVMIAGIAIGILYAAGLVSPN